MMQRFVTAFALSFLVSTLEDVEDAFCNPAQGRPFLMRNPRLAPKSPFTRASVEGVSPNHAFVRGPNDPASLARKAYGAERAPRRDLRSLSG